MKWLVTFLLGMGVGATGLFVDLRAIADAPSPIITEASAGAAATAPAAPS
ncbi:MAG: hypothetical protein JWP72_3990, partial [Massilia sp.]|nr:hypothetical protein [Massilia sp.]